VEIDIDERLKVARRNLATLQAQRDTVSQEVTRFDVLILKYTGSIEYLESLKLELLEPSNVKGDGHRKDKKIPEKSTVTKQQLKE